jgi:hypothetical protein
MAIADFLWNFRNASLFVRPRNDVGGSPPTTEQLAEAARYYKLWLTPHTVEGFEARGFYDLSEAEKGDLEHLVDEFRRLAERIPPDRPPTEDEVRGARRLFVAIRRYAGRYIDDPKVAEVVQALDEERRQKWFPDFVVDYDAQFGLDHTGDPAIWVWFIVTDEAAEDDRIVDSLPLLRTKIYEILAAKGVGDRLAYINFRTLTEQEELLAGVVE